MREISEEARRQEREDLNSKEALIKEISLMENSMAMVDTILLSLVKFTTVNLLIINWKVKVK